MVDKSTLEQLFDRAASNLKGASLASKLAQGKAFELYALLALLRLLRKSGFAIAAANCPGGVLRLPGGPAIPDKSKHTYFKVVNKSKVVYEVWQSLEVTTLSRQLSGSSKAHNCAYHEVDVGVFRAPLVDGVRPNFDQLVLAGSCKYRPIKKEQVREALGLRRETGLLAKGSASSAAPWFKAVVPANPPVPIVLFSKDPAASSYCEPVDHLGLYVRQLVMP